MYSVAAQELYDAERGHLIADFYNEAYNRDELLNSRKTFYENYIHAATSLSKSRIKDTSEKLVERRVEIESDSFVKRENHTRLSQRREAVACFEIRNLVKYFNKQLWPTNRMAEYKKTLAKQLRSDKLLEIIERKTEKAETEIEKLNDELQALTRKQLLKEVNLKSEMQFMTKLMREGEVKSKIEEASDFEKIKHLVSVCGEAKKLLKVKVEKGKKIESTLRVCAKLEKISDDFKKLERYDSLWEDVRKYESFESLNDGFDEDESLIKLSRILLRQSLSSEKLEKAPEDEESSTKLEKVTEKEESFEKLDGAFEKHDESSQTELTKSPQVQESLIRLRIPSSLLNITESFFQKLSKVQAECVMLRQFKDATTKHNCELTKLVKDCERKYQVEKNFELLQIDPKSSVGNIRQVAHLLPQIVISRKMQKSYKLCKNCRDFYGNL